jgi:hypothetical protein
MLTTAGRTFARRGAKVEGSLSAVGDSALALAENRQPQRPTAINHPTTPHGAVLCLEDSMPPLDSRKA